MITKKSLTFAKTLNMSMEGYKREVGNWIVLIIVYGIISFLIATFYFSATGLADLFTSIFSRDVDKINESITNFGQTDNQLYIMLYFVGSNVISQIFTYMWSKLSINSLRNKKSMIGSLMPDFEKIIYMFIAGFIVIFCSTIISYLLFFLINFISLSLGIISILAFLGFIPMVVFIIKLGLYPYFILKGAGPIEAVVGSWKLTNGYFWKMFGIYFLLFFLLFLGMITFSLVSSIFSFFGIFILIAVYLGLIFVFYPISIIFGAYFYKTIGDEEGEASLDLSDTPPHLPNQSETELDSQPL